MILAVVRKMILRLSPIYVRDRIDLILRDAGDMDDTRFFYGLHVPLKTGFYIVMDFVEIYMCQ